MADGGTSKGAAFGIVGLGVLLVWSGIQGKKITAVFKDILAGKSPATAGNTSITGSNADSNAAGDIEGGGNSAISSDATRYIGAPYKWGGYLPSGWDCSGFVNYVLGHDLGYELPGGFTWTGKSHGPVVGQYQLWTSAQRITKAEVRAGDIVLFTAVHMGIAVSNTDFVSAEDPANGTQIAPITSGPGPANYLRVGL